MANADGLKRKTFVASLWSVLRSVWSAIITFVLFAVMARLLAPADFGVFALASIVVEIARIVATAGLGSAIVREPDRSASFDNTVFWCVLGLSLAAAEIAAGEADPNWKPDVVHVNDWPSALAPGYMRWKGLATPSILTIHNLAFQGQFPPALFPQLGLPASAWRMEPSSLRAQPTFHASS